MRVPRTFGIDCSCLTFVLVPLLIENVDWNFVKPRLYKRNQTVCVHSQLYFSEKIKDFVALCQKSTLFSTAEKPLLWDKLCNWLCFSSLAHWDELILHSRNDVFLRANGILKVVREQLTACFYYVIVRYPTVAIRFLFHQSTNMLWYEVIVKLCH